MCVCVHVYLCVCVTPKIINLELNLKLLYLLNPKLN